LANTTGQNNSLPGPVMPVNGAVGSRPLTLASGFLRLVLDIPYLSDYPHFTFSILKQIYQDPESEYRYQTDIQGAHRYRRTAVGLVPQAALLPSQLDSRDPYPITCTEFCRRFPPSHSRTSLYSGDLQGQSDPENSNFSAHYGTGGLLIIMEPKLDRNHVLRI
jgi:hypothetical protein